MLIFTWIREAQFDRGYVLHPVKSFWNFASMGSNPTEASVVQHSLIALSNKLQIQLGQKWPSVLSHGAMHYHTITVYRKPFCKNTLQKERVS